MKKLLLSIIGILLLVSIGRSDEILSLPAYVTTASSATGEINFDRTLDTFSDNSSFINTPRSVSSIDNSILEKFNISSITDISSYISDAQTFGSYGQSSNINVRGDMSEQYVNNERRTNNSFGFNQSFNAVESVDVVHGAPSVVFGPGFYSGGYTDFNTKQAGFVPFTKITFTLGDFLPSGNSFLNTSLTIDENIVINDTTAIRISHESQRDQTFYYRNGGGDDAQDLYITVKKIFNSKVTLDFNSEFSWQAAPELIGINRVTQNLIWHDEYITGAGNPYDFSVVPNGPTIKLNPTDTVLSVGDFSNADVLFTQAILVDQINPIETFKNYTMFEDVDRRRFNQYEYAEYVKQYTFDNRTEFHINDDLLYTIIGIDERYEFRDTQTDYDNTFFNAFDISKGNIHSSLLDFPSYYISGIIGDGGRSFFDISGDDYDTAESKVYSISTFLQQRIHINNNLQFLYGIRADGYRVFAQDPLNTTYRDDTTTVSYSNTESLLYSLKNWSVYTTIGRLSAVNASQTGGAILLDPNNKINNADFHSLNKLYEIGARYQSDDFSVGLTGFLQWRQQHNFYSDSVDNIYARGVEFESKYQGKNYFVLFNLTYLEDNFVNSLPFEFNGIGLPAATVAGNYRVPGISKTSANLTAGYKITRRIEVSGSLEAYSSQEGDALEAYHIPGNYSLNTQITYSSKYWSLTLAINNLTNQDNFIHNGDEYGDNVLLGREMEINGSMSYKYKF